MTTTTKQKQTDMHRAAELMRVYAQSEANLKKLQATIANEVSAYRKNMQDAERELLEIGERNKDLFVGDNLHFTHGYLHIASTSIVTTTRKFNWPDFLELKGDLVKIDFEKAKVKKAWLDSQQHNELIGLGVQIDTVREIQVIANKDIM